MSRTSKTRAPARRPPRPSPKHQWLEMADGPQWVEVLDGVEPTDIEWDPYADMSKARRTVKGKHRDR